MFRNGDSEDFHDSRNILDLDVAGIFLAFVGVEDFLILFDELGVEFVFGHGILLAMIFLGVFGLHD